MNRFTVAALIAALGIGAAASSASAQSSMFPGFQIGAAAGGALPTGDLSNTTNTGYNVTLAVGFKPTYVPLGVRLEAAYSEFGGQGGFGSINIPAFTGNLTYSLPGVGFSPYAIGGAGLYRPNINVNGGGENHFGFNVGGGVKLPLSTSFETFAEARYNRVRVNGGSLSFIPITVGIMW